MLGAIAGDVVGSVYEGSPPQPKDFPILHRRARFTDDSVLTIAVGQGLRTGMDFAESLQRWGRAYPDAGYGGWFIQWLADADPRPYNSFGNGAAMRVSAGAWAHDEAGAVLDAARASAAVTHDHPEGVRGAQAVAAAILAARHGLGKAGIRACIETDFGYDLSESLASMQQRGGFDVTCQGTVPMAAVAFLESTDFEDAVRNAVSLGGDADTIACVAGSIAEAHYGGVPAWLQQEVLARLDTPLTMELRACAQAFDLPLPDAPPRQ